MRKIPLILFALSFLFYVRIQAQAPKVSSGSIVYVTFKNSKYIPEREIAIWLPLNYSENQKYNVIYMHDAQSLFDTAVSWNHETWEIDEAMQQLISSQKIQNTIVIGIYNAEWKRRSEFFPKKVFDDLSQGLQDSLKSLKDSNKKPIFNGNIQSDNYLKFLVNELKPFVDSSFSTNLNQSSTFIAGSSMGALISLYALCEYPNIFGGAACISTHWTGTAHFKINEIPEAILLYFYHHIPSADKHKIYFDYGSIGLDSLYKPYQNKMDEIMRLKGYQTNNWITKEFIGEGHDEKAWKNRINIPIEFLLKK